MYRNGEMLIALLYSVGNSCTRIYDEFCTQTNSECGHNMVYKTVERLIYTDETLNLETCIQECKCISDEYVQSNGQCIKQNNIPALRNETERISEILPKYCAGRLCALDEKVSDTLCSLTGKKCGLNMVFKTVHQSLRMRLGTVPSTFRAEILPKYCAGRECALDEEISDVSCTLAGKICGTNMIFGNIGKSHTTNGAEVCFQKCTCISEEYIKTNGQCILSAKRKKTTTPILTQQSTTSTGYPQLPVQRTIQKPPETRANCEGRSCEIRDPLCTLTSRKCGHNMVYKTSERLIYIDGHLEICIQQCKCISEEYIEKDGRCIKQERKENETQVT
ncbi:unnamed protein product [Dracunculus medinensis]|uniref:CTCK domain-containing protein n=1 Tax=Dracunculus medinensis TaxID=318479 RepID=A0A0N4URH2_DRAME|nr:unnamed protein product [Dracunculus medinensis]